MPCGICEKHLTMLSLRDNVKMKSSFLGVRNSKEMKEGQRDFDTRLRLEDNSIVNRTEKA